MFMAVPENRVAQARIIFHKPSLIFSNQHMIQYITFLYTLAHIILEIKTHQTGRLREALHYSPPVGC